MEFCDAEVLLWGPCHDAKRWQLVALLSASKPFFSRAKRRPFRGSRGGLEQTWRSQGAADANAGVDFTGEPFVVLCEAVSWAPVNVGAAQS